MHDTQPLSDAETHHRLAAIGKIILDAWKRRRDQERSERDEQITRRVIAVGYRARVYDAPPESFEIQFWRMQIENDRLNREVEDLKRSRRRK